MVVKVKLSGLKIVRARRKYYVYARATGEAMVKGFAGSRADLLAMMAAPDFMGAYNARRKRPLKSYPDGTLGSLVWWFKNECVEFKSLSERTQGEYSKSLDYLEPEFDSPLSIITQAALYETRDKIALARTPYFADNVTKALSTMFTKGVKRGKMPMNPALGIEDAHKADPNANREWLPQEWKTVFPLAPVEFQTLFMLARHAGYRGQSLIRVQWSNYLPDPVYGKCFRMTHKKNSAQSWVPATPELQKYLDGLDKTSVKIATRDDGSAWRSEKQMQTAVSNWLNALARKGLVGDGLTLHGLRVSFAAGVCRKTGASSGDVAAALGDRDERMGQHYTRHVEQEARVVRAFGKPKKPRAKK